jgi:hypothetical protein
MLQAMCQNNCKPLQEYLRDQPDNSKSLDLIDETVKFGVQLVRFTSDPREKPKGREKESNVRLVTILLATLTEFCKGSVENQVRVTRYWKLTW